MRDDSDDDYDSFKKRLDQYKRAKSIVTNKSMDSEAIIKQCTRLAIPKTLLFRKMRRTP